MKKIFACFLILTCFAVVASPVQSFAPIYSQIPGAGYTIYLPLLKNDDSVVSNSPGWMMAGANPERTSWTQEEVPGKLKPAWYHPFKPYILPRVQIIAAYGLLYISTAEGLYALVASSGEVKWVYPTDMPLGHSPTVLNGIAYVGGFDHKLHAVDALTGKGLWTFTADAGFDTNPLVMDGRIFIGNRDGNFYAIFAQGTEAGKLAWKYKTDGPIHFSAAYKDNTIYFASDDSYAYALNAQNGALIWRSEKLPGSGFHSWWPVIFQDWIIFPGSNGYRYTSNPGPGNSIAFTSRDVFPNREQDAKGTLVGPLEVGVDGFAAGTPTFNASKPSTTSNGSTTAITEYLEQKPWRRTVFVLNRFDGKEYTTDFDGDHKPEYAPFLWFGNEGAENRYPPVASIDGNLYLANTFLSDPYIPGGQLVGWQVGSRNLSIVSSDWGAMDEPMAYSGGGKFVYWNLCCDRQFGAIDITMPNTNFTKRYTEGVRPPTGSLDSSRERIFFNYNLPDLIPGYNIMTYVTNPYDRPEGGVYGGRNGVYGFHGEVNPPVPYQGMVFMHRSNAVIAFKPDAPKANELVLVEADRGPVASPPVSKEELSSRLAYEVQKILSQGHLRPGFVSSGVFDLRFETVCGDDLIDYWHYPGDIQVTLINALPHIPPDLQAQSREYLLREFKAYPPYAYNHIGWRNGAPREAFDLPLDVQTDLDSIPPQVENYGFVGWGLSPHSYYSLWKYAQVFGGATSIFDASKSRLETVPSNSVLVEMPFVHNAYIAGYIGYLGLEKLAGYPESTNIKAELDRLLALRASQFSIDAPESFFQEKQKIYCRSLNVSRNFMYMVPELAQYLHDNSFSKVEQALAEYEEIAPYWFVSRLEVAIGESVTQHFYDYHSIFQAKARIMKEPYNELVKYLDVPAVKVGDLFYIDNLITAIEADY